ncbi:MAG: spermidine N(1)-acetyltransferase [Ferruginibacter sp.]|nr:spermidine N(1)-acetyltransferase [Ferruginibacter sp.]
MGAILLAALPVQSGSIASCVISASLPAWPVIHFLLATQLLQHPAPQEILHKKILHKLFAPEYFSQTCAKISRRKKMHNFLINIHWGFKTHNLATYSCFNRYLLFIQCSMKMNTPPYDQFPRIIAKNILLRAVLPQDIPGLVEISFYEARPAIDAGDAAAMQEKISLDYRAGNSIHWAIADPTTNQVMGTLGYYRGFDNNSGELGCVLKPAFRGKGIMMQAMQLAISFGFNEIGLAKITAGTSCQNQPAINLLERLGFARLNDEGEDDLVYELIKPA